MTAWIILIVENIFLLLAGIIWFNRHCQQCQQVKCLERIFTKTCRTCQEKEQISNKKKPSSNKKERQISS